MNKYQKIIISILVLLSSIGFFTPNTQSRGQSWDEAQIFSSVENLNVENPAPVSTPAIPSAPVSEEITKAPSIPEVKSAQVQAKPVPASTPKPTQTQPVATKPTVIIPPPVVSHVQPPPASTACASGNFSQEFLCLINQYRGQNGKSSLSYDNSLNQASVSYSMWMNSTGIFSHTGENGSIFTDRCAAAGTTCRGENLAKGFKSAAHLFEMWKASAGHNANMLKSSYSTLGIGTAGKYATTLFR